MQKIDPMGTEKDPKDSNDLPRSWLDPGSFSMFYNHDSAQNVHQRTVSLPYFIILARAKDRSGYTNTQCPSLSSRTYISTKAIHCSGKGTQNPSQSSW